MEITEGAEGIVCFLSNLTSLFPKSSLVTIGKGPVFVSPCSRQKIPPKAPKNSELTPSGAKVADANLALSSPTTVTFLMCAFLAANS